MIFKKWTLLTLHIIRLGGCAKHCREKRLRKEEGEARSRRPEGAVGWRKERKREKGIEKPKNHQNERREGVRMEGRKERRT